MNYHCQVLFVLITVSRFGLGRDDRCGFDHSVTGYVEEGEADIETYPWLGLLFYPVGIDDHLETSTIVLITHRMAIAAALDIDKYPKEHFRTRSRAVLGRNCSGPQIRVRDYVYHPDFTDNIYNTIAMVQLETHRVYQEIHPICPPPAVMTSLKVYAMSLTHDCTSSMVRVYKMLYVDPTECQVFYRKANLDIASLWPTHFACARATRGGYCVWRSGTVLVVRQRNQWRLLGFGVNGPGCEAPARFLDYGMYRPWVRQSLSKIGRPAITRVSPGLIILRRSLNSVPRYGICDPDETRKELFIDESGVYTGILEHEKYTGNVTYNLTLFANVEYSCVLLHVFTKDTTAHPPEIRLRRYCTHPFPVCYDSSTLQVDFSVQIHFYGSVVYQVSAYGREIRLIDVKKYRVYANQLYYGFGVKVDCSKRDNTSESTISPAHTQDAQFFLNPHIYGVEAKIGEEIHRPFLDEESFYKLLND